MAHRIIGIFNGGMLLHKLQVILGACKCIQYTRSLTLQLRHYWLPTMASGKLDTHEFTALLTPGEQVGLLNKYGTNEMWHY